MEVTVKKVEITLPEVDMALLKELAKKFGWNIGRKKSGIEGTGGYQGRRTHKAKNAEDNVSTNPWLTHVPVEYTTNFKKDL